MFFNVLWIRRRGLLLEDDVKLYVELARKRDIGLPSQ